MEVRLLWASLWRRRGTAALAALAAAMHVSGDVGSKLTHELRSLGPNLLLTPSAASTRPYLDESLVHARLAEANARGMPVLHAPALAPGPPPPRPRRRVPCLTGPSRACPPGRRRRPSAACRCSTPRPARRATRSPWPAPT